MAEKILAITYLKTLHTFAGGPRRGADLSDTGSLDDAGMIWNESGKVLNIGSSSEILKEAGNYDNVEFIDGNNGICTPGLIDSHTHSVNAGSRSDEFVMRCQGADYMEILKSGGGILNSADKTRQSSIEDLVKIGKLAFDRSMGFGVTTIETKSGYGLDTKTEIKMLKAVKILSETHSINVKATFLGAHAIPREYKKNSDQYVDIVIDEMLPLIARSNLAEFCDIFIEDGVFSVEQGRRILDKGNELGLRAKVHVDEIVPLGGVELCCGDNGINALSIDHLIAITDSGIETLANSTTVGCLLPGTSFFLKKPYAPCRKLIDAGCLVSLATDNNPGSSRTENLQWIMTTACLYYGLTPSEAFSMTTINAAAALGIDNVTGSLDVGKQADFVLWDSPNLEEIAYHHGVNHVGSVYIGGKKVVG